MSLHRHLTRQLAQLEARIAEASILALPVVVWRVRCVYPSTSVVVKVKGKTTDEAVDAARHHRLGKGADDYVVIGSEPYVSKVSGPIWKRIVG